MGWKPGSPHQSRSTELRVAINPEELERLIDELAIKAFPWIYFSTAFSYRISKKRIRETELRLTSGSLQGTHFAILTHLRLRLEEKNPEIRNKELIQRFWPTLIPGKFYRRMNDLIKLGFVEQKKSKKDLRESLVWITKEGLEAFKEAEKDRKEHLKATLQHFSADEIKTLIALSEKAWKK